MPYWYMLSAVIAAMANIFRLLLGQISDTSNTWSYPLGRPTATRHTYVAAGGLIK